MKPTAACLAGFLMLVLLAGCKGSADESGARENKGDIEAHGNSFRCGAGSRTGSGMRSRMRSRRRHCRKNLTFSTRPMTDFI